MGLVLAAWVVLLTQPLAPLDGGFWLSFGAVIVRDRFILATGYNGSIPGLPHCDDAGHMMEDGHCVRTLHAEQNAIIQAALHGVNSANSTIYVTHQPMSRFLTIKPPVIFRAGGDFYTSFLYR